MPKLEDPAIAIVSTFVMLMASFDPALTTRTAASLAVLLRGAVLSPGVPRAPPVPGEWCPRCEPNWAEARQAFEGGR